MSSALKSARVQPASAEYALRVAATLWPSPSNVSLERWTRPSTAERDWLLLPSPKEARWLLPASRKDAARALQRYDVGQRNGAALSALAALHAQGVLNRLPLLRVRVSQPDDDHTISYELMRILQVPVDVCVRLGRRRVGRGVVLHLLDRDGGTAAFVKLSSHGSSVEAIRREENNLRRVSEWTGASVIAPTVLYGGDWRDNALLVMTPLRGGEPLHDRATVPVTHMLELARAAASPVSAISDASFVARQADVLRSVAIETGGRELLAAHQFLVSRSGGVQLELGWWHGDWVPWNMAWAGGRVQLWDWEHFAEDVPVGWDIVHFLSQRLRNDVGRNQHCEDRWREEATTLLKRTLGLDDRQCFALLLSYLIEINARYLTDRAHQGGAVTHRVGWGLPLLQRLQTGERM